MLWNLLIYLVFVYHQLALQVTWRKTWEISCGLTKPLKFFGVIHEDVCPCKQGGLGIGYLGDMNEAFKIKLLWRFPKEEALWKRIVKVKHGLVIWIDGPRKVCVLVWWVLKTYLIVEVNSRSRVLFTNNGWSRDQPLKVQFWGLFRRACLKETTVFSGGPV